jgi:hypothetical protein
VTLHRFKGLTAEGDPVIDVNIVADYGGFSDYDTHAVVDEESTTDCGTWMYLNTGPESGDVRKNPGKRAKTQLPKPVVDTKLPDSVKTWRSHKHLKASVGCRVTH